MAERADPPLRVALTIDAEHPDRPTDAGAEPRLLDALDEAGITATFFVQGRWAEAFPERARRIARAGHLVGSHGFYHARMPLLTDSGLATDIADAGAAIANAAGVDPRPWFRCPFGAGMDDPRILLALAAAGYRHVGWDVNPEDWEPGKAGVAIATTIVDAVLERAAARQRDSIVLLHSWPVSSGQAVALAIARLREHGAAFVRIDDLLPA